MAAPAIKRQVAPTKPQPALRSRHRLPAHLLFQRSVYLATTMELSQTASECNKGSPPQLRSPQGNQQPLHTHHAGRSSIPAEMKGQHRQRACSNTLPRPSRQVTTAAQSCIVSFAGGATTELKQGQGLVPVEAKPSASNLDCLRVSVMEGCTMVCIYGLWNRTLRQPSAHRLGICRSGSRFMSPT